MRKLFWGCLTALVIGLVSCSDDSEKNLSGLPNDPTKPIQLTSFMPDSGGVATQVIIEGSNFGTDASKLKVYFNKKRAKVVRAIGNMAYVLAPKLPGDTCTISVVMGDDSLQYEKEFYYRTKVLVSTITGNAYEGKNTVDGTLAEARFNNPWYLVVDHEKNILVGEWKCRARLISEERNSVVTLLNSSSSGEVASGCLDYKGEVAYFPMNGGPYYYELDPEQQWMARRINPTKNPGDEFDFEHKYSLACCELDSMLYTITTNGELVKINPKTRVASLVMKDILKDRLTSTLQVYLAFHPIDKHMLYFVNPSSMAPQDGPIQGTDKIYRIDMRTLEIEDYAGSGIKGHLDGPKETAEFNNPCQICFDQDGNMYVGDTDNYCVRKISPEGIVTTVVGIPGTKGYLDGDPDVALFNRFWGMKIDPEGTIYIADYYNSCIRKLEIQ